MISIMYRLLYRPGGGSGGGNANSAVHNKKKPFYSGMPDILDGAGAAIAGMMAGSSPAGRSSTQKAAAAKHTYSRSV